MTHKFKTRKISGNLFSLIMKYFSYPIVGYFCLVLSLNSLNFDLLFSENKFLSTVFCFSSWFKNVELFLLENKTKTQRKKIYFGSVWTIAFITHEYCSRDVWTDSSKLVKCLNFKCFYLFETKSDTCRQSGQYVICKIAIVIYNCG